MGIAEILPLVESLPHDDKFRLMQFLVSTLAIEEGIALEARNIAPIKPIGKIYHSGRADISKRARELLFKEKHKSIQERRK